MTPNGDFAVSCQGYMPATEDSPEIPETPPPHPGLIPAPPGGAEGMRWTGETWVDDADAEARAWAFIHAQEALVKWRRNAVTEKWRVIAALNLLDVAIWPQIQAYAADPECDVISRAAIEHAENIPRMSEVIDLIAYRLGWDNDQVDALFRAAMQIRG